MPCKKHGPRASVTTKTSAFGLGFCLLSPSGHVFHIAWQTMIKSCNNDCQLTRNAALAFCVSRSELCSLPCWKLDCTRLYALAKSKPDGNPCLRREYSTSRKSCSMIPQAWFNMAHTPSTLELERARLGKENNLTLDILNYLTHWPLGDFNLILGR